MWHYHNLQLEEQYYGTVRRQRSWHRLHHRTRETTPRVSQGTTQPMEWTPTKNKDEGANDKMPPKHSQERTQPAPPLLTELYTQYRERHSQEATQPMATNVNKPPPTITAEPLAHYQQAGEGQTSHITDAPQLTHSLSRADDVDMNPAPPTLAPTPTTPLPLLDHALEADAANG